MHVSPKSETVELPANDTWLVLAPPELDRVISWHHSINEAMGRLVRLIDQVVVETNPPSQGSRPSRSGSITATKRAMLELGEGQETGLGAVLKNLANETKCCNAHHHSPPSPV